MSGPFTYVCTEEKQAGLPQNPVVPPSSAPAPKNDEATKALTAAKDAVTAAIDAAGKTGGTPAELTDATAAVALIGPLVTTLNAKLDQLTIDHKEVDTALTGVEAIKAAVAGEYNPPLTALKNALDAITIPVSAGGKRKHTRRKHCKHGKNIMHCPYCKKQTRNRKRRTRKSDSIARSLERSLNESSRSKKSKKSRRSRRKSK